jgi:hypothetical protein
MSTIIATTLSNGSVSVPTATVVNGSAKAWVNFNGTGTIAARDSFNVASLTDNGAGDYSVNFSSATANTNYVVLGTKANSTVNNDSTIYDQFGSRSVSTVRVTSFESNTLADSANINTSIDGDLA